MIDLSLGEFGALVAKAFRGAGYSWGLAEEASFAARRLAAHGLPAAVMCTSLLSTVDGHPTTALMPTAEWTSTGEVLCPICIGASIVDLGGRDSLTLDSVVEPLFVAPILGASLARGAGRGYSLAWPGGGAVVSTAAISVHGEAPKRPVELVISRAQNDGGTSEIRNRIVVDNETLAHLEAFAHRVYAPATDASRESGAGAGLLDND